MLVSSLERNIRLDQFSNNCEKGGAHGKMHCLSSVNSFCSVIKEELANQ